jgi:hypothetical protein
MFIPLRLLQESTQQKAYSPRTVDASFAPEAVSACKGLVEYLAKYNPNQSRDRNGKFSTTSGSGAMNARRASASVSMKVPTKAPTLKKPSVPTEVPKKLTPVKEPSWTPRKGESYDAFRKRFDREQDAYNEYLRLRAVVARKRIEGQHVKKNPECKPLRDKMLAHGGRTVGFDPGQSKWAHAAMDKRGTFLPGTATLRKGDPNSCYWNVARLAKQSKGSIRMAMGYALSDDGHWRGHAWGITKTGKVIETTVKREAYFGFVLTDDELRRTLHVLGEKTALATGNTPNLITKYVPNQPRDRQGRFATTGGGGGNRTTKLAALKDRLQQKRERAFVLANREARKDKLARKLDGKYRAAFAANDVAAGRAKARRMIAVAKKREALRDKRRAAEFDMTVADANLSEKRRRAAFTNRAALSPEERKRAVHQRIDELEDKVRSKRRAAIGAEDAGKPEDVVQRKREAYWRTQDKQEGLIDEARTLALQIKEAQKKAKPDLAAIAPLFAQGKASVSVEPQAKKALKDFFGRSLAKRDVAELFGVMDGAKVKIDGSTSFVSVTITHPLIKGTQNRTIWRDPDKGNKLVIHNDYFELANGAPRGLGTFITAKQVTKARALGVDHIATQAARSDKMNGYYTWPRLGFDGEVSEAVTRRDPQADGLKGTHLRHLMATKKGRDWWLVNGGTADVEFDLHPTSYSSKHLNAYFKESFGRDIDDVIADKPKRGASRGRRR